MEYKKDTKVKGALRTPVITEVPTEKTLPFQKGQERSQIESIFDLNDSVADNAKMISLIMTTISRMYDSFTATQKDRIPQEDRDVIEYTFATFAQTETRADVQFTTEGITLIDKLLNRQGQIGDIFK